MAMRARTWHWELLFVAFVEFVVTLYHGLALTEVTCALAVTLSFAHAQVADRLAERDAARIRPSVECHRWATRYLVTKELAWTTLFALTGTWTAIAGSAMFALYPLWRRLWRKVSPRTDVASCGPVRERVYTMPGITRVTVARAVEAGQMVTASDVKEK